MYRWWHRHRLIFMVVLSFLCFSYAIENLAWEKENNIALKHFMRSSEWNYEENTKELSVWIFFSFKLDPFTDRDGVLRQEDLKDIGESNLKKLSDFILSQLDEKTIKRRSRNVFKNGIQTNDLANNPNNDNVNKSEEFRHHNTNSVNSISDDRIIEIWRDLPIHRYLLEEVLNCSQEKKRDIKETSNRIELRTISSWFNAISVSIYCINRLDCEKQLLCISNLESVHTLDLVRSSKKERIHFDYALKQTRNNQTSDFQLPRKFSQEKTLLNYGNSFTQLNQIGATSLHSQGFTGKGVRILITDSGFYTDHNSLSSLNIVLKYNFVSNSTDVQQGNGNSASHGTATLSVLSGKADGLLYGAAFDAELLLAVTEDINIEAPIEEDYLVAALEWGEKNGADVVSCSLGYRDWYRFEEMNGQVAISTRAVNIAVSLGVVVVVSNGNYGHFGISAPADSPMAISVGAIDAQGVLASFSSMGPTADARLKPEICALGIQVWAADHKQSDTYRYWDGTSFSAPLVAGVAALLLEEHPDWTPDMIKEALIKTSRLTAASPPYPNVFYGFGLINSTAAMRYSFHTECEQYCNASDGECLSVNGPCQCKPEYFGRDCSIEIVNCSSFCYLNHAACIDNKCTCFTNKAEHYEGMDCSIVSPSQSSSVELSPTFVWITIVLVGFAVLLILLTVILIYWKRKVWLQRDYLSLSRHSIDLTEIESGS